MRSRPLCAWFTTTGGEVVLIIHIIEKKKKKKEKERDSREKLFALLGHSASLE